MSQNIAVPFSSLEQSQNIHEKEILISKGDKLERISVVNFAAEFHLLSKIASPISPTDPNPNIVGFYKPTIYSDAPGTNYPNLNDLKAVSGFDTLFYFDGIQWRDIVNEIKTKSIYNIEKTSTIGLVDTYTITYTDGSSPTTFQVTNGSSTGAADSNFTQFNTLWSGNNYLSLNSNNSIIVDKTKSIGYLIVTQDSTGNRTLTVENKLLDINLNANQKTLIGYVLIGTDLMFSINKNLVETTVSIPDAEPPTAPTVTTQNITHNSVNLIMTGANDNVGVVGYDVFKDGVFLTTTSLNDFKVIGLTLNTNYKFKVKAKDANGNLSLFSNEVSITTLAQPPLVSLTFSVHDGSFTTLSDGVHRITSQNEVGVSDQTLLGDGYFEFGGNVTGDMMFGLDDVSTLRPYGNPLVWNCHVIVGKGLGAIYVNNRNGTQTQIGSPSGILKYRLSRTGAQVKLLKSTNGTDFVEMHTYPNVISGQLWLKLSNPVGGTATTEYVKLLNS